MNEMLPKRWSFTIVVFSLAEWCEIAVVIGFKEFIYSCYMSFER